MQAIRWVLKKTFSPHIIANYFPSFRSIALICTYQAKLDKPSLFVAFKNPLRGSDANLSQMSVIIKE